MTIAQAVHSGADLECAIETCLSSSSKVGTLILINWPLLIIHFEFLIVKITFYLLVF